ncbi:MAG: hypothetical protein IJX67_11355 [Oscillospiraceae bacterium]|nr:hypothetical protein [Oscillospiraceae bacterium]
MKRTNKIWCILIICVVLLAGIIAMVITNNQQATDQLKHKTITGNILSYMQTSDGVIVLVDDDATSSNKEILITGDTLFTDDLLKQSILNLETELYIIVESEFWTQTYDGIYPAVLISPAP